MEKQVVVDLPERIEKRFLVFDRESFLKKIEPYFERIFFSENEFVQTIYFNNEEHVVPFGFSIKARRYLQKPVDFFSLLEGKYFLDLKKGIGENKEKIRFEVSLEEAARIVNEQFKFSDKQLRRYVAVEYLRNHFVPKNSDGMRITVDDNASYFFFPDSDSNGIEIGKESGFCRVEIKSSGKNNAFFPIAEKILSECNAIPIISKKFTAYNFLGIYLAKTFGKKFRKELKNCEIESKMELESENVFHKIKKFFENGNSNFRLPVHFPFTFSSASINRYYKQGGEVFKAMFRGKDIEIVRKKKTEFVGNKLGLNCILKREEMKGEIVPINSELISSAELLGELYRMRKAFWIVNSNNNRFYHITLDCCVGRSGTMHELEVEYTGVYSEYSENIMANEAEIVNDIAEITQILLDNFPELKPSTLTKQEWLGIE